VTPTGLRARRASDATGDRVPGVELAAADRSLLAAGAIAAGVVTASGLAAVVVLVLIGWIAAPHAGVGLPAVLRTSAALWLVGQHVGFTFRGAGRIGLLPLGLVLLPGALLWRAGRWVVRISRVRSLRHIGYAALALAVPYGLLTGALAIASRSALESSSLPQSVACGLLLAMAAGGLGGAREVAPWPELVRRLPPAPRSLVVGIAGALAALVAAGALLAGISLASHLSEAATLERDLSPGAVGAVLLLLLEIGYVPNAIAWAISFMLGPGFAVGASTVVAPTGSALQQLPAFPMLAALPPGLHAPMPAWVAPAVLAMPYLAGVLGGLLLVRAAPALSLDAAPLLGLACGGVCGVLLGLLAAASGGPLGDGRLAAVGPSGWQVGIVSALEIGIAAAAAAGAANYRALRRAGALTGGLGPLGTRAGEPAADGRAAGRSSRSGSAPPGSSAAPAQRAARTAAAAPDLAGRERHPGPRVADSEPGADETGHVIYLDPWAGDVPKSRRADPPGPSAIP
jgi:Family of unknown function (DUF6350)